MRTFIAIELSDEFKDILSQIQSHLKYSGADVKWVDKDNVHLTLKFLGEVSDKKVEDVTSVLERISKDVAPFEMTIKEIGAFPKLEYPRVIWVGLDKGLEDSRNLAQKIDEGLSKIGFQKETRPFAAHLTIGRVRSPKNKEALKEKVMSADLKFLSAVRQSVNSVILFKSDLTPKGPIYTKLHEAKLIKS